MKMHELLPIKEKQKKLTTIFKIIILADFVLYITCVQICITNSIHKSFHINNKKKNIHRSYISDNKQGKTMLFWIFLF